MKSEHLSDNTNSIDKINDYYENLSRLLSEGIQNFEFNFDCSHNSAVARFMLQNSSSVCMYCGSMSVFSKNFYEGIEELDSELSLYLREEMQNALRAYLHDGNKRLRVILEQKPENENFLGSFILDKNEWENALGNKSLEINYLPGYLSSKKMLNHFSFTEDGRISRLEQDRDQHSAVCILNPKDGNKYLMGAFKKLKKFSLPYVPKIEDIE